MNGNHPGRKAVVVGFLTAVFTTTGLCHAGVLKGHITVSGGGQTGRQQAGLNPDPGALGPIANLAENNGKDPQDVVVFIEGAQAPSAAWSGKTPEITQSRQRFVPRVLGIPAGTTVEFPNEDLVFHNVFSYSKSKRFDLGYYGRGKSKSVRFEKAGLVKVFCDIHSNMAAYVLVVKTPFVTQPGSDGHYEITGIPDGEYVVNVWHPQRGTKSKKVVITDGVTQHDVTL